MATRARSTRSFGVRKEENRKEDTIGARERGRKADGGLTGVKPTPSADLRGFGVLLDNRHRVSLTPSVIPGRSSIRKPSGLISRQARAEIRRDLQD